ncbi:MAG: hypothetical protein JW779_05610 [Candidatus Thorarchaeota archaeon]|nr:hypothetical protein [Candidatus Thorarchaeota archaeon]
MAEVNMHTRTARIGWIITGWLLTLIVAILWILSDTITTLVFAIGIGLGVGISCIIILNETLILTTIETLQRAGESAINLLNLRKNMRVVLAIWIMGLFSLVIVVTLMNQLELDKFSAIMGVLGSFVASIVAYYFATSRNEDTS